jgi:5'-deoxynucleotidase YfbR-like HD superfamily hydrolase
MVNLPTWINGTEIEQLESQDQPSIARPRYLTRTSTEPRFEYDPIFDSLPLDGQREYLQISKEVRQGLTRGLGKVWRWKRVPYNVEKGFKENDLDHTQSLLELACAIEEKYPDLYQEICGGERRLWLDFLTMIILHDAGEIKVDDLAVHIQSEESEKKKILEQRWTRYAIHKSLPREEAQRLIGIYQRFENPADDDKAALAAKVLDRLQGSVNVARHIMPFNRHDPGYLQWEYRTSQGRVLDYASKLLELLKHNPAATNQMQLFLQTQLIDYFDALEVHDIDRLRGEIRDKFPVVFARGTDL